MPAVPEPLRRHSGVRARRDALHQRGRGRQLQRPRLGPVRLPIGQPVPRPHTSRATRTRPRAARCARRTSRPTLTPTGLSGAVLRIDPVTGAAACRQPVQRERRPQQAQGSSPTACATRSASRSVPAPATSGSATSAGPRSEEIDKVTPGTPAENFGWPCKEGNQVNGPYQSQTSCDSLSNETPPQFTYDHSNPVVPGDNCLPNAGSVISGLAFYGDGAYPNSFNNGLFFTDYARNCIWFAPAGGGGEPNFAAAQVFARGVPGVGPVDLQTAPNGNLVYVFHDQTIRRDPRGPAGRPARLRGSRSPTTSAPRMDSRRRARPRRAARRTSGTSTTTARSRPSGRPRPPPGTTARRARSGCGSRRTGSPTPRARGSARTTRSRTTRRSRRSPCRRRGRSATSSASPLRRSILTPPIRAT